MDGDVLHVGLTGTRHGFMPAQRETFLDSINGLTGVYAYVILHHGDCVGVDAQAHRLLADLGIQSIVHPPDDDRLRAFCHDYLELRPPKPYHTRNEDIVYATSVLYAVPETRYETPNSGTWWTVNFARQFVPTKQEIVCVIYPDGELVIEAAS